MNKKKFNKTVRLTFSGGQEFQEIVDALKAKGYNVSALVRDLLKEKLERESR